MTTADNIRNILIDNLLTISDENFLAKLNNIVEKSTYVKGEVILKNSQITMLEMSEEDIKNGRLITNEELNKRDLEWLNGL
jgi:hypothetical protein